VSPEIASTCYISAGDGTGHLPQDVCFPFRTLAAALPLPPPRKKTRIRGAISPLCSNSSRHRHRRRKKITVTDICPWLRLRFRVIELGFGNRGLR